MHGVAAMRPLVGDLPEDVRLADGRVPSAPGEGVVGGAAAAALHLGDVVGGVTDGRATVGVVGRFEADGALAFLDDLVLYRPAPDATDARAAPGARAGVGRVVRAGGDGAGARGAAGQGRVPRGGRRRDLGRRRALGASRSAIVALVLLQTFGAGCLGALLGTVAELAAASAWTGATPPWAFAAGVGTTAVLRGLVGAVPPALLAAFRDPVRILRVP